MKPYRYKDGDDARGLVVIESAFARAQGVAGWTVDTSGCLSFYPTAEDAESVRQEMANAIADDVHGAELADLRKRIADAMAAAEKLEVKADNSESGWWIGDDVDCILAILKGPPA